MTLETKYVSCERGHIYCVYCVKLILFRIQLALFVKDDDEKDLYREWEKDYCKQTVNMEYIGVSIDDNKSCFRCCEPNNNSKLDVTMVEMVNDDGKYNKNDENEVKEVISKPCAIKLLRKRLNKDPNNIELPLGILDLDYGKYGVYCMTYVLNKLEIKQRDKLFMILEYICMLQPTATTVKLIIEFKEIVSTFPVKYIDNIFLAVINGSKYSICAALKVSHIAKIFSQMYFTETEPFTKLCKKYERIAFDIINNIESNHLAAMLLETHSDIDDQSPVDMAFDFELHNFLSQAKIQKMATEMWGDYDFLKPTNIFDEDERDIWDVFKWIVKTPWDFLNQVYGKFFFQIGAYIGWVLLFTYILTFERPTLYDDMTIPEIIFWYLAFGYIGNEIQYAFFDTGVSAYLKEWTNYVDLGISINLVVAFLLKVIFGLNGKLNACNDGISDTKFADWNYNTGYKLPAYAQCPTTIQICT